MASGWEQRGRWIEARVARSFVQGSESAVHAWVRWADGTYGSFQGVSARDVTERFPAGSRVDVLVDPAQRLRNYRMALDAPADGPVDRSLAEPADEPALARGLIRTFSGGTGGREASPAAAPAGGTTAFRPPRPVGPTWAPLAVGIVLLVVGAFMLRMVAGAGQVLLFAFPAAFGGIGLLLLLSVLWPALALARLRRAGQRVPAVVVRSRQVLARGARNARFRWQVIASATIAGQALELVSEHLRDDPTEALPPGTVLTALVDPKDPTRYRLLLDPAASQPGSGQ